MATKRKQSPTEVEMRGRQLAQIVRDFMQAFVLAREIGEGLRNGSLDFSSVQRLVGDSEDTVLFRLKEGCHALFRHGEARPRTEVQAEELFDLAVGALFHETMKFREGYYLTTSYGPRLQRMMAEGVASGALTEVFESVFEAGRRRMIESEAEATDLFRETRDQLLIVLHQMPSSGSVARSLIEEPERTETVFGRPLPDLLVDIYGSAENGYRLAIESLIENGHFAQVRSLLEREDLRSFVVYPQLAEYAQGMEAFYSGDNYDAVELLSRWVAGKARGPDVWAERARKVLARLAETAADLDPKLSNDAARLADSLKPARAS